jgi:hypothetical protein
MVAFCAFFEEALTCTKGFCGFVIGFEKEFIDYGSVFWDKRIDGCEAIGYA